MPWPAITGWGVWLIDEQISIIHWEGAGLLYRM